MISAIFFGLRSDTCCVWLSFTVALVLTGWRADRAVADSFEIRGGGQLTGRTVDVGDHVVIELDQDTRIAVEKFDLKRRVDSAGLKEYRRLVKLAGDDAEKHYQLGRWCRSAGNLPGFADHFRDYHMERAIELNPEHSLARGALGYTKDQGKWILTADLMRSRGMIRKGGRWVLPEAVTLTENGKDVNVEVKRWRVKLRKLIEIVQRGEKRTNRKFSESVAELTNLADPLASEAVAVEFERLRKPSTPTNRRIRRILIDVLARLQTPASVRALVEAGIEEDDEVLRERALTALQAHGSGTATRNYLNVLRTPNAENRSLNRAASALQWFPNPEHALIYVKSLVTQNTVVGPSRPAFDIGFGGTNGNAGDGFATGAPPKKVTTRHENPAVLALVKSVVPGVDFGYDEVAWIEHLAAEQNKYSGDLRRDP